MARHIQIRFVLALALGVSGLVATRFADGEPAAHHVPVGQARPPLTGLTDLPADTRETAIAALRAARPIEGSDALAFSNAEHQIGVAIGPAHAEITGPDGPAAVTFRDARLGRGEDFVPMTAAVPTGTGTAHVTLARSAGGIGVTEWWANDADGLEQGFVVAARPSGSGPLEVRQTIATSLTATLADDGRAVEFSDAEGARLTFGQPAAWDADGRALPMHLTLAGTTLGFVVDDDRARYPVTIDPTWVHDAYIKASNTAPDSYFGDSVAIDGDTMVVGADRRDSGAGAAYVFVRTGTSWAEEAYLPAPNVSDEMDFGRHLAISGKTVVVGARKRSDLIVWTFYVFVRNGTTWQQQASLQTRSTSLASVAVSGDTIAMAAERGTSGVCVFVRSGTTWTEQAFLTPSTSDARAGISGFFGHTVAISGDSLLVTAPFEDNAGTGSINPFANSSFRSGAAYVFTRSGVTWSQQAYLKAPNPDTYVHYDARCCLMFGYSGGISGDILVVGAPQEASAATGVNGDQTNTGAPNAGAAYVFVRDGTTWTQQAYLKASNRAYGFGTTMAIAGETVVVSAPEDQGNPGYPANGGAAYVFARSGSAWSQRAYFKTQRSLSPSFYGFGRSVAVSGRTVVIGAPEDSSSATGVDGNRFDTSSPYAGAAHTYVLPVAGDFNRDDYPDLLFQHTTGPAYLWNLQPGVSVPMVWNGTPLGWTNVPIVAVGDLTSDGRPDLLVRSPSSTTFAILEVLGTTVTGQWVWDVDTRWRPVAIADVNIDGRDDLIWQGADGEVVVWFMSTSADGTPVVSGWDFIRDEGPFGNPGGPLWLQPTQRITAVIPDRREAGVDFIVQDSATGILLNIFVKPDLTAHARRAGLPSYVDPSWQIRATADFNRDGELDFLFQNTLTSDMYIWYIVSGTYVSGTPFGPRVGLDWKVVGPR